MPLRNVGAGIPLFLCAVAACRVGKKDVLFPAEKNSERQSSVSATGSLIPDTLSEKQTWGEQKFTRRLENSASTAEISKRLADFCEMLCRRGFRLRLISPMGSFSSDVLKQVWLFTRLAHFGFAQDRLRLGNKNKSFAFCFVFHSPCTIFAYTN